MDIASLGEPIAGTTNLYEWGDNQLLKLYGPDVPGDWVRGLVQRDKALYEAGLPVAVVGELLEIEDSLGQVYEKIEGPSLADGLLASEADAARIDELAVLMAEAQAQIHACQGIEAPLPRQKALFFSLLPQIEPLPADLTDAVLNVLEALPEGNRLCHGDFHPFNVLIGPRGPVVIDWNNAHLGNPLEDVARSKLMLVGFGHMDPGVRDWIDRFIEAYLDRYFQLSPAEPEQIEAWWPVVAAIRLLDNIPELEGWLLDQIWTGVGL